MSQSKTLLECRFRYLYMYFVVIGFARFKAYFWLYLTKTSFWTLNFDTSTSV